jgi:hypothetical protein
MTGNGSTDGEARAQMAPMPRVAQARLPPAPDNGVGDVLEYVREHEKYMGQSAHELTQAIEVHVSNYLGRMRQRLLELERVIGLKAPRGGGDGRG